MNTFAKSKCNTVGNNVKIRWIKLDLGDSHKIGKVTIWSTKTNMYRWRMDNAIVSAGDKKCGTIKIRQGDDQKYEVDCNGAQASTVMLSVEPDLTTDTSNIRTPCIEVKEIQIESGNK